MSGNTGTVASAQEFQWIYDALDRLTSETLSTVDTSTIHNPTPTLTGTVYSDTYTLDLVGNRLQKAHTDSNSSKNETITYVVDARDELTSETSTLTSKGTTTYGYDANGATITSDNTTTNTHVVYTYDLAGHLYTLTNGATTTYLYDAAGNRIAEIVTGGASTYYLTDWNNPTGYAQELEESATQGGSATAGFAFGNQLIAQEKGSVLDYLLTDGHGSTRILTSSAGAVLEIYTYDAYGDAIGFDPTTAGTSHLFTAEQFDAVSGWYNQRARWYVTRDGRFSSADDQGYSRNSDPLSLHKYLYANGNPISGGDPTGRFDLMEMVVNTAVSSILGEILSPVIKPAVNLVAGGLAQVLLPQRLQNMLSSFLDPDAFVIDLPAAASFSTGDRKSVV
jgi:RHS repeat-associated protein